MATCVVCHRKNVSVDRDYVCNACAIKGKRYESSGNIIWNILMLIIGGLSWTQFFHVDNYVMRDIFEKIGLNYGGTVDVIMGISYLILVVIPIIYFRYIRVNKPLFWIIFLLATVVHPIYRIMNLLN